MVKKRLDALKSTILFWGWLATIAVNVPHLPVACLAVVITCITAHASISYSKNIITRHMTAYHIPKTLSPDT